MPLLHLYPLVLTAHILESYQHPFTSSENPSLTPSRVPWQ